MKTAVEQFAIALYEGGYLQGNGDDIEYLFERCKEMEKNQIIDAHRKGQEAEKDYWNIGDKSMKRHTGNSMEYYNKTYGGNK